MLFKTVLGALIFFILNLVVIPILTLYEGSFLFFVATILQLLQIIVGFTVIYGIIYSKLTNDEDYE